MSAAFEVTVDAPELERLSQRISKLAESIADTEPLMQSLATELESQTRRRISSEKAAPDGTPWKPWSDGYAKTRHGGQSLLESQGHLIDSIVTESSAERAATGSNLVYAALHQAGGTEDMEPGPAAVEARPWLGVSAENEQDLQAVTDAWVDSQIGEALR